MSRLKHLFFLSLIAITACNTPAPVEQKAIVKTDSVVVPVDTFDSGEPECIRMKTEKKKEDTYPFNEADKIQIVSYADRPNPYSNNPLIVDDKFIVKGIKERITLTSQQTDTLFSILYDFKYKRKGNEMAVTDCYTPHHTILFYKQNKPFAYLEVCLDCGGTRQSANIDFGEFCHDKKCILYSFFKSIGVKHGFGEVAEFCR